MYERTTEKKRIQGNMHYLDDCYQAKSGSAFENWEGSMEKTVITLPLKFNRH